MTRATLLGLAALLLAGCCCAPAAGPREAPGDLREYVILGATSVRTDDHDPWQVFLLSKVIATRRTRAQVGRELRAMGLTAEGVGAWSGVVRNEGGPRPEDDRQTDLPAVVVQAGDEATVQLGSRGEDAGTTAGYDLHVTVDRTDGRLALEVRYVHREHGREVARVDARRLVIPDGGALVLEARRP